MRLKVIACDVLFREISDCAAHSHNVISTQYLIRGLHDNPEVLRETLQRLIDDTENENEHFDAVLLGYGLCNNAIAGLRARRIPLVLLRAHDCITLFLGAREEYSRQFSKEPGTYYYTSGWMERAGSRTERKIAQGEGLGQRFQDYAEKYGEENARYLMEIEQSWVTNYSRAAYIALDLTRFLKYDEEAKKIAREKDWRYEELKGDIRLIRDLINGEWRNEDFLVVPPGERVVASHNTDIIESSKGM